MSEKKTKGKKLKNVVGWGISAYEIIMKNKIIVIVCLFIQGVTYVIRPMKSIKSDAKNMILLTGLYALVSAIVIITSGNKITEKGKKIVKDMYKDYFAGKQKKVNKASEHAPNEILKNHAKKAELKSDKAKNKVKKYSESFLIRHKWIIAVIFLLIFAVCVPLYFFPNNLIYATYAIIGAFLLTEGVFSIITVIKTKDSVRPKDKVITLILAVFSIAMGVFLVFLPAGTASEVLRVVGAGLIIKALGEFWVIIRNRGLISSGKETFSKIKNINKSSAEKDEPEIKSCNDKDVEISDGKDECTKQEGQLLPEENNIR